MVGVEGGAAAAPEASSSAAAAGNTAPSPLLRLQIATDRRVMR